MRIELKLLFRVFAQAAAVAAIGFVAGCCSSKEKKEKPLESRGWMGGSVCVVSSFPKSMTAHPNTALLITSLATNTPAAVAGLHEGDLILAVDHQPVKNVRQFRSKIDSLPSGTPLPITACRENQTNEFTVTIGRETFRRGGMFTIYFPTLAYSWDPWPHGDHPGCSAIIVGYRNNSVNRVELGSVKEQYDRKCDPKNTPYNEDYKLWLVLMEFSKGKHIAAQELAEGSK